MVTVFIFDGVTVQTNNIACFLLFLLVGRNLRVMKGGPNPISQQIVFSKFQLKSHNPSLCCSN